MSIISRVTTWISGQLLTSSALNGEFNNIVSVLNSLDAGSTTWDNASISTLVATTKATVPNGVTATDAVAFGQLNSLAVASNITLISYYLQTSWGAGVTSTTVLKYDTKVFDSLSEYTTSTGLFAPTNSGYYFIYANADIYSTGGQEGALEIYDSTGSATLRQGVIQVFSGRLQGVVGGLFNLSSSHTYSIRVLPNSGGNLQVYGNSGQVPVNATMLSIQRVF